MIFIISLLNFIILFLNRPISSSIINTQLHHYEFINLNEIQHRIHKRSIDYQSNEQYPSLTKEFRQIEFNAFNRKFRLILNERRQILGDNFKAYSVDQTGRQKEIKYDADEFYEGNLIGAQRSDVTAHIEKKTGLITGSIYDDDEKEAYFLEPYANLFNKTEDDRMIIYRQKDIKDQHLNSELKNKLIQHFVDSKKEMLDYIKINETVNEANITNVRPKRQLDGDNFWTESKLEPTKCSLRLVADYTFVEEMGNRDATKTINFLVNLISEVDTIFKRTNWTSTDADSEPMIGYGFLVAEILIHEQPFSVYDLTSHTNSKHYNMLKDKWKVRDLLEVFSRTGTHKSFCLSHLFTHRTFENGILGLAYVSSPRQYSYGGICSQPYYKDGGFLYLNTGLTTTRNSFGNRVLTRQAVLITAHELGHNFGAEHDPMECSPKAKHGGAYIMNTFSVSSYDANNHFFSMCSKRSIKSVLKVKAKDCFSKPKSTFCGNGIVEKGEECDSGLTSSNEDKCCTKNCRLKAGAVCNDRNSPCCRGCKYFNIFEICLDSNELDCKKESYCNGRSAECPKPDALPDDTICGEDGQCMNGECVPFCEKRGLMSCMCDRVQDACRKCCRESLNSTCTPYPFSDGYHFHRDGTICSRGFCAKGKCLNVSQDYVERFWSIIDDIEYNSFTMFLKDNLVCCVIFVSLIIFIPSWYLIEQYDLEMKKKLKMKSEKNQFTSFQRNRQSSSIDHYNQSRNQLRLPKNRQQFSTSYNQSRNQLRLPKNRQQFSTSIPGKFKRVLDESNYNQATSNLNSSKSSGIKQNATFL